MKTAIYPGSFNPWHAGHQDVLAKALKVFDRVIVVKMQNPEKLAENKSLDFIRTASNFCRDRVRTVITTDPTLKMVVEKTECDAVIRGLRNGHDLQYEMNQQYWNEDVGIKVPFVYFITDRKLSHVSSSSIRMVNNLGLKHDYSY